MNTVVTTLTVLASVAFAGLVVVGGAAIVGGRGRRRASQAVGSIGPHAQMAALVVATTASAGSLYYSEVLGLRPCTLCWDQRICMFSLVLILAVGVLRRDRSVFWYATPFAVIGAGIALNHLLEERGHNPVAVRPLGSSVLCAVPYFRELGFVTMAVMAFSAFLLIAGLLVVGFAHDRPPWRGVDARGMRLR